jgi:hypothetical protein
MKKTVVLGILVVLSVVAVLAFRPINTNDDNRTRISGTLISVSEVASGDIIFKLQGNDVSYYINRGTQKGHSAEDLQNKLQGKSVEVEYADHWTLLDPAGKHRHITGLRADDHQIYSE